MNTMNWKIWMDRFGKGGLNQDQRTGLPIALLLVAVCCLLFPITAIGGEQEVQPTRKIVPAEDGLNIVCEIQGRGELALVFLHGWCGDHEFWKEQVEVFAPDYRVVALDQAGHGSSGKRRQHWSIRSLAADVESVVKALDLKQVILVGHSMGGPIALMAAQRMPSQVIAVVGVDTLQNVEMPMPEDVRKRYIEDFTKDFPGTLRMVFNGLLPEHSDAELRKWILTKAEAQDPKMALALMQDLLALDAKPILKDAGVPVSCINSGGEFPFFRPTAIDINQKYGDFNAVLIDNVGHFPMLEKPAEFNKKLRDILKQFASSK